MYPSYSPLFTSGLLAEHTPVVPPLEETPRTRNEDAPAFCFTLWSGKRDTLELRSFLYLDLADHKWHPPSQKRKCPVLSKSSSWTCTADVKPIYDLVRAEKPTTKAPPSPAPPTRRRASKESMRTIPSPKPAPSTTLPDLPIDSDLRLSPSPLSSAPLPSPSKKRAASTVASSLHSPTPPRVRRPALLRSESISSHDRRKSRMDALACLEGRSRAPHRIPRHTGLRNNFMSFSDDEDDRSTKTRKSSASPPSSAAETKKPGVLQVEDLSAYADVEDEADAIIPHLSRKRQHADPAKPARPRKRRSTLESWFPLKSFIDLKDDDLSSWNWRSFIEIGGVA